MAITEKASDATHFLLKRSELNTGKLFVEFYLPKYQALLQKLRERPYPLHSLSKISKRIFDGPFGSDRKIDMYQESGIPYMRVKDIQPEGIDFSDLVYISEEKHSQFKRSCVLPGNVLITIAGRVGTAAVFPNSFNEGNITGHIVGIELPEDINPYYIATFINSYLGEFQVIRLAHRTTRPELNLSEVGQILIPIPPLNLQNLIAKVMQDAYATYQQLLLKSEKLLLEVETNISEKLNIPKNFPNHEHHFTISRSQLNRFDVRYFSPFYTYLEQMIEAGNYETKCLREVCEKISSGFTPAKSSYTEQGSVVIKAGSLTKNWLINWQKIAFTSEILFDKSKKAYIKDGDLLILSASHQLDYIGRNFSLVREIPTEYDDKCMAVGELIIVRPDQKQILPEYLLTCFILKPIQELVNKMSRGQTAHLYAEDLQYLRIPIPPLEIQQEIGKDLDRQRNEAYKLKIQAKTLIEKAKVRVEEMILNME